MSTPIPKSISSPNTGPATTDTASVESKPAATTPAPPAQPKKAPEDPKSAAKAAQGSKQLAEEQKSQNDRQGQVVKNQLANQVPGKDRMTSQQKGAHYMTLQQKGGELAAEIRRAASSKPSFAESEQLIQKVDAYRREVKEFGDDVPLLPLYNQEIRKPPRMMDKKVAPWSDRTIRVEVRKEFQEKPEDGMTNLLGAYGYSKVSYKRENDRSQVSERISQTEILDTALHNWRSTPREVRQSGHGLTTIPAQKGWRTPIDTREWNRRAEADQIVMDPQHRGDYMGYPAARRRAEQPDPDAVLAKGQYNATNASWDLINALAGGVAAKGSRTNAGKRGTAPEWIGPEIGPGQAKSGRSNTASPGATTQPQQAGQAAKAETGAGAHSVDPRAATQPQQAGPAPSAAPKPNTDVGIAKTQPGPPQPPVQGRPPDGTVGTTGGGSNANNIGGRSNTDRPDLIEGTVMQHTPLKSTPSIPDSKQITIKTLNGQRQMTVGEYRQRVDKAKEWASEQLQKLPPPGKSHDYRAIYKEAGEKFRLDKNWFNINNPYAQGKLPPLVGQD